MPLFALYQLWVLVLQPYLSAPRLQVGPCLIAVPLFHRWLASSATSQRTGSALVSAEHLARLGS